MRFLRLTVFLLLATAGTMLSYATPLPVGTYNLSASTTTMGIHQSPDQGTLTGTLTFDASSLITSADLTFNDVTSGRMFSFTDAGPTAVDIPGFMDATILNAINPTLYYAFSIALPSDSAGDFRLTCGTDCDNFLEINDGHGNVYEEVSGSISPSATPEPSSLVLFGTGVLGVIGAVRRRFVRA